MSDKRLKMEFVNQTLKKIESVLNLVLSYYEVELIYDINDRNKIFCEMLKKSRKREIMTNEMFHEIQTLLQSKQILSDEQKEYLTEQIYAYHKDLFLLHYFYAAIYSYNNDDEIQKKIDKIHIEKFFEKANVIYEKYQELMSVKKGEVKINFK